MTTVVLILLGFFAINYIGLWLIIAGIFVISIITNLLIIIAATRPTRDLMAAIINVSGEKSDLTLPNPNTAENERTGMRDALQTIYELSTAKDEKATKPSETPEQQMPSITDALDIAICGFIILDKDRKVVYQNKSAPVHTDAKGVKIIDLLFNGSDTLDLWLDSCKEHSIHDEHVWVRIPDRLPNEEGRRFFDVIASYQKGSTSETVLNLIDRTSSCLLYTSPSPRD